MSSSAQTQDQNGFKKPTSLGSKSRSFIPMTPRNVKTNSENRNDFARQVADHTGRGQDGQPPQKKFRSNAAPKGTRLASGYVDRAQERMKEQDDEGEDKQKRLKALEEMLKLQQIDTATFEKLRDEIGVGGDTSTTHLVKGLDFKLLERIRRGEDLEKATEAPEPENAHDNVDVDEKLEKALDKDTAAGETVKPEDEEVDGTVQTSIQYDAFQTVALSRNEILELMKQRRKNPNPTSSPESTAKPVPAESGLDHSRFRKLESKAKPNKHKFTESINGRRREVLIITDKQGNTKRKTRWLDPEPEYSTAKNGSDRTQAWGGDLPAEVLARMKAAEAEEVARQKAEAEEEDDGDIFGGVADYNPLAVINSDEDEPDAVKDDNPAADEAFKKDQSSKDDEEGFGTAPKPVKSTSKPRNYFATSIETDSTATQEDSSSKKPTQDPAILAALKRAAQIRQQEEREGQTNDAENPTTSSNDAGGQTSEGQARSKALLQKLQRQSGYDDMDIDMGFGGGSRYDDEEDEGDGKQKLSQWTGIKKDGEYEDEEEEGEKKGGGAAKRKRGGGAKKKKGDKNSFTDVMNVIEGRKKG